MRNNKLSKMGILLIVVLLVSAGVKPISVISQPSYPTQANHTPAVVSDDGYTISGRVTDKQDKPLAGITLKALVATSPIVFVHGLRSFPPQRSGCTPEDKTRLTDDAIGNQYFGVVDDRLALSYPVFYAHLVSNPCYTAPLAVNVQHLKDSIDAAKASTQASKVILIAHDMGGLISRAYIEESAYQGDVETLFTFGSPHQGTSDDVLTFLANGVNQAAFCQDQAPAACDLSVLGARLFNLNYAQRRSGVNYYVINGDAPAYTRSPLGLANAALIPGPDDGFAPTLSGTGLSTITHTYQTDENHNSFGNAQFNWTYFDQRKTLLQVDDSRSFRECLKPILIDHSSSTCQPPQTAQASTSAFAMPAFNQRSALEFLPLANRQVATRTLQLEAAPTLFASSWPTGTVTMTLRSPSGVTIDAAYAVAHPEVVSYTVDAASAAFYFPSLAPGAWKMVLQAGQDLPAEGITAGTLAAFDSPLLLSTGVDLPWYTPGATATITAALHGAVVSSALITATLHHADGTQAILPLTAQGDRYQASYPVPSIPGYTQVDIRATGVLSPGQPFERAALSGFQISPQTILPTGVYTDAPRLHSLNGYFDRSLVITTGVNVVISGTYSLSADLLNSQGNLVAHSVTRQNLPPGPASLPLEFIGQDIYTSGSDGPYTLSNLLLSDQSAITLVTAEQQNIYQTQPYDHKQFGVMLAQFSASPTSGIMPLVVQFTNTSTGYFDTSLWNFGDNITSVLTSPKHTYSTPGLYTVTLSMSGGFGTSIETKVKYITVYPPSQANFTASPTTGIAPLQVQFTNTSIGNYYTSQWDFGDGATSSEQSPIHTYATTGAFTVTLTVADTSGVDSEIKPRFIKVYRFMQLFLPLLNRPPCWIEVPLSNNPLCHQNSNEITTPPFTNSVQLPAMQEEAQSKKMESVNTSYTAVSDSNGYFIFSNLPAGTYFLQPILPGQTFVPESRSVTVPVSASGQDFKRTSTPPVGDMILIPAGDFQMGCSPNDECGDDEKPLHTVYLDDYAIDKYEVTNARYIACEAAGGCTAPHEASSASRSSYYNNPDFSNYPVIHIDWSQAEALCKYEGKRLPTEAEWEKAARGPGNTRIYPWGDAEPDCTIANFSLISSSCVGDTSAVGSYPTGASPYGVLDMAGNVWEWVNDYYQWDYYTISPRNNPPGPQRGDTYILRGGPWDGGEGDMRVSRRIGYTPDCSNSSDCDGVGFRCAQTP